MSPGGLLSTGAGFCALTAGGWGEALCGARGAAGLVEIAAGVALGAFEHAAMSSATSVVAAVTFVSCRIVTPPSTFGLSTYVTRCTRTGMRKA
jgi:hypothetical protein